MQVERAVAAILALVLWSSSAQAQSVRDIPAPKEIPPASFIGPQYVDSDGCVFVRAGLDGKVIWVPRVDGQRKILCGYPPSLAASAAPEAVSVPPPAVSAPEPAPTKKVVKVARTDRVKVKNTVSKTGDAARQRKVVAPMAITLSQPMAPADLRQPVVPKGYKLAWKDGRLNPDRARGTAQGQAQQDMIWSRDTPMRLLTAAERAKQQQAMLRVSSKSADSK